MDLRSSILLCVCNRHYCKKEELKPLLLYFQSLTLPLNHAAQRKDSSSSSCDIPSQVSKVNMSTFFTDQLFFITALLLFHKFRRLTCQHFLQIKLKRQLFFITALLFFHKFRRLTFQHFYRSRKSVNSFLVLKF